jgi:hypothetical protein
MQEPIKFGSQLRAQAGPRLKRPVVPNGNSGGAHDRPHLYAFVRSLENVVSLSEAYN